MPRTLEERWNFWTDQVDSNGNKISDWCIKGKSEFTAYCEFCNTIFTFNSGGKFPFMQHAKSIRHVTAIETKKNSQMQFESILENNGDLNLKSTPHEMKPCDNESEPLSEYEMMLARKRAEKQEFLNSLAIDEIKHDVAEIINSMKRKKPREFKEKLDPVIQRASKRKKEHVSYSQKDLNNMYLKKPLLTETTFENTLKLKTEYEKFVQDFSEIIEGNDCFIETPVQYDRDILRGLSLQTSTKKYYTITAMSWLHFPEDLVLAVGDSVGNLGLSTFKNYDLKFYTFPVHSKKITHLQSSPYNPSHLISSGLDGKMLCCDIQAQTFSEVLNTSERGKRGCTDFDFISPSCCIVSLTTGHITITDSRQEHKDPSFQRSTFCAHNCLIHTINVHPVDKKYFVTVAARDEYVHVWDLRKIKRPVISKTHEYKKKLVSAAFSPVSGNFLLTKSHDLICIYDCAIMTEKHMKCYSTFECTNKDTTEHLRPIWMPNSDDTFACSGFSPSHTLCVFDKDFNSYGDILRDGCKKHFTFHPFKNALACVSTSDKISVYV